MLCTQVNWYNLHDRCVFILMNDFHCAGIDTDKHKYPIGSARITFGTRQSYLKAVAAAFVEIQSDKFRKKVR